MHKGRSCLDSADYINDHGNGLVNTLLKQLKYELQTVLKSQFIFNTTTNTEVPVTTHHTCCSHSYRSILSRTTTILSRTTRPADAHDITRAETSCTVSASNVGKDRSASEVYIYTVRTDWCRRLGIVWHYGIVPTCIVSKTGQGQVIKSSHQVTKQLNAAH